MSIQQLDIFRISMTVAFALIGIILIVLGVKEAGSKKKKQVLFIFGGMLLSTSIFAVSLLVKSVEIRDILTSIAVVSTSIVSAFVAAFIIGEYRRTR
jgi:sulfite exporter TauE/SafE